MSTTWMCVLLAAILLQSCSAQASTSNAACTSKKDKCACNSCHPGPGIAFGEEASNIRSPAEVVGFLEEQKIKSVRLYHTFKDTIKAFKDSDIELTISISNADIKGSGMAWNYDAAEKWVKDNVLPYSKDVHIKAIAVGNEVTSVNDWDLVSQTEPAMRNIHEALKRANLKDIKVSTPFGMDILEVTWPPSAGAFRVEYAWNIVKPVLAFLNETNSPFMINIYPYVSYKNDPKDVNLDAALLNRWCPISVDFKTGHVYKNLLFQLLDATVAAMGKMGFPDVSLLVSETGWPSAGHAMATPEHAAMYNQNLVNLVVKGVGTPLRPSSPINAFIYSLFNENMRRGEDELRNYGLFNANFSPVYDINWEGEDVNCVANKVDIDSQLSSSS
ncbi:protein MpGH17.16 [Marchantia polymorpha subsp. ruderalis]|uniref:Glucan endo-1,3-beta-D-glucosidase n=2 Tax=Marchantia polymorpha TaxID=3197 RepID=A0A176WIF0_MARPO|nr:hypothetical protein AXG93_1772s1050 [Marchantia polymorpha subsp. ruderalis]PTQ44965.1 hypothetical protein MARPO_0016s0036 [Marchantia polymorpha]BBN14230.1 hypothetical protein Mp_6g09930 [Marchantia polymorpha subsp. ruderalis]|eukprot:PTQ44965.1 hypothetical protein MARPO_0016s0036 [Marchantia polymorpha]